MGISKKLKQWQFNKLRVEMFSDAVFAIVITLLVLELKVPHIEDPLNMEMVKHELVHKLPILYSWVISFFFIAIMWLHHHNIFNMISHLDYAAVWINIFLLFFICILPFPTGLMGEYPQQPLFVAMWGVTVSLTSCMLVWFYYYVTKHYLTDNYDAKVVRKNVRLSVLAAPVIYLVGAGLAFVDTTISFVIYFLVPILYMTPLDKPKRHNLKTGIEH
jgi:uncharacterized membrane protein